MSLTNNTVMIESLLNKIQSLPKINDTCEVTIGALSSTSASSSLVYYNDASGIVRSATYDTQVTLTVKKNSLLVAFNCNTATSVSGATLLHYDTVVATYLIENNATLTFS